jgi:hypothetical protein
MNQMQSVRRRLDKLERLRQVHPVRSPLEQIEDVVLRQITDEDLAVMINMTQDRDAGVRRLLSEEEWAMLATYIALRDTEAKLRGFESFAEAERIAGR